MVVQGVNYRRSIRRLVGSRQEGLGNELGRVNGKEGRIELSEQELMIDKRYIKTCIKERTG